MKQAQGWSIEVYVAVAVMLIAIVFFASFMGIKASRTDIDDEATRIAKQAGQLDMMDDGVLSNEELQELAAYDCAQLQEFFTTNKNICIYFKDEQGTLLNLSESTGIDKIGIGCPEILVNGMPCS
jgi:hypothetical protein